MKSFFFNSAAHTAESAPNTPAGPLINRLKRSFELFSFHEDIHMQRYKFECPLSHGLHGCEVLVFNDCTVHGHHVSVVNDYAATCVS